MLEVTAEMSQTRVLDMGDGGAAPKKKKIESELEAFKSVMMEMTSLRWRLSRRALSRRYRRIKACF